MTRLLEQLIVAFLVLDALLFLVLRRQWKRHRQDRCINQDQYRAERSANVRSFQQHKGRKA